MTVARLLALFRRCFAQTTFLCKYVALKAYFIVVDYKVSPSVEVIKCRLLISHAIITDVVYDFTFQSCLRLVAWNCHLVDLSKIFILFVTVEHKIVRFEIHAKKSSNFTRASRPGLRIVYRLYKILHSFSRCMGAWEQSFGRNFPPCVSTCTCPPI